MEDNPFFYVSLSEGQVNGYLLCASDQLVGTLVETEMFHHEGILSFLHEQERPFVYGESIGVRDDLQRTGIGDDLMQRWYADMSDKRIQRAFVMVRHNPAMNKPSIDFCNKHNLIYTGKVVLNRDCLFGIYAKEQPTT